MALLQITEPGGKPPRPAHRRAVGIDLGTTNSLVATVCGAIPETLADDKGETLLPSVVRYVADGTPLVGSAARAWQLRDPANTIVSAKRWLGKSREEIQAQFPGLPYTFDPTRPPRSPAVVTAAGSKDPVAVAADLLRHLAARAAKRMKGAVEGAVVTVPAHFNDAQRQQTREAAERAGIPVLRLLNEPTAAAVAYGLDSGEQGNVVVFDLGGGTFDVSLLRLQRGVFEVLATGGDANLGGDDFDRAIMDYALRETESPPRTAEDSERLREAARELRHRLTAEGSGNLEWGGRELAFRRELLATVCDDLLRRTRRACRRVLRDGGLTPADIANVVLVGGATRMPMIRAAVEDMFGRPPLTSIDPDRVVAIGAAIQADMLIGNKSADDFLLLDVNPLSLGIETAGELVEKIIPRNTAIPVARAAEFTTFKDGQTAMSLHVVQGERELAADCRSLARFELRGLPPMAAGAAKVRVTFQVDADGLLSVSAEEVSSGRRAEVQVKPSYGLGAAAVEEMLASSHGHAAEDMQTRALKEAELHARQLLAALAVAREADGGLLGAGERARLDEAARMVEEALAAADLVAIREATENLNRASEDFANRRMDMHIARALTGENIANLEGAASRPPSEG